ncbi:hypothetical protein AALP_AA3G310000 [Arabis alpina]|uniref:Uncharacterized protein n=1 Tax=Arabis alpina TaxID=50452 RepID=A0A087HCU5_ARAAL|nr:hypothetical protein AALP_AA3G310000 [Arabis alpina]
MWSTRAPQSPMLLDPPDPPPDPPDSSLEETQPSPPLLTNSRLYHSNELPHLLHHRSKQEAFGLAKPCSCPHLHHRHQKAFGLTKQCLSPLEV